MSGDGLDVSETVGAKGQSSGYSPRYFMESDGEGDRLEAKTDTAAVTQQLQWAGLRSGMRALDVGCGTGAVTRVMATMASPGDVIGIDASSSRLAQAHQLASRQQLNIGFIAGDASALPLASDQFDLTWCRFLFEYLPEPECALAELIRVTRPGGTVLVADLDDQIAHIHPLAASTERELQVALQLLRQLGVDPQVGRKLYAWCYSAGLQNLAVRVEPHQIYAGGLPSRDLANWREKLSTAAHRLTEHTGEAVRWRQLCDELFATLQRSETFYYSILVLVRGTVPTG